MGSIPYVMPIFLKQRSKYKKPRKISKIGKTGKFRVKSGKIRKFCKNTKICTEIRILTKFNKDSCIFGHFRAFLIFSLRKFLSLEKIGLPTLALSAITQK